MFFLYIHFGFLLSSHVNLCRFCTSFCSFFGKRLCNIFSVSVFLRHSVPFCLHVTYSQFRPEIYTCWYCIVSHTIVEPDDDDDDDEEGFIHPFCFSFMRSCSSWVVKYIYNENVIEKQQRSLSDDSKKRNNNSELNPETEYFAMFSKHFLLLFYMNTLISNAAP